ncbi:RNA polymerase sigma factor [Jatrophihabitans fulvus]
MKPPAPTRHERAVRATASGDAGDFAEVYDRCAPRVYAYARRHCEAADAPDVVSDTFLVAWRRWDDVPRDDPLPWLLVVARNTIRTLRRSALRRDSLTAAVRLQAIAAAGPAGQGADDRTVDRDAVLRALASLTDREREAVLLVAWDGLTNSAAARVAGCSQRAFEVRLSRARARLERCLDRDDTRDDVRDATPRTTRDEPRTRPSCDDARPRRVAGDLHEQR